MMKYMLERAEPHIVKTELTKNRTCQTYRWKQVAMSDDLEALKSMNWLKQGGGVYARAELERLTGLKEEPNHDTDTR